MRKLADFDAPERARILQEALRAEDIACELRRGPDDTYCVWILVEEQVPAARQLLQAFLENPDATRFSAPTTRARTAQAAPKTPSPSGARPRAVAARVTLRVRIANAPATAIILVASTLATVLGALGRQQDVVQWLSIASYRHVDGFVRWRGYDDILHGQLWRLFTPMLLHFGFFHLVFNAFWLLDLGAAIERFQGTARFSLFIALCAAASNLAQFQFGGTPSFGGLSGVVYALVGYLWTRGRYDPLAGIGVPPQLVRFFGAWMLLGFTGLLDQLVGPMANYCHTGGFVSGALYGYLAAQRATRRLHR